MEHDVTAPQPRPTASGQNPDVGKFVIETLNKQGLSQVAADHEKRIAFGERKYGQRLKANNGRDALMDCYQEALDGCSYSGQLCLEGKDDGGLLRHFAFLAAYLKGRLDIRTETETKTDDILAAVSTELASGQELGQSQMDITWEPTGSELDAVLAKQKAERHVVTLDGEHIPVPRPIDKACDDLLDGKINPEDDFRPPNYDPKVDFVANEVLANAEDMEIEQAMHLTKNKNAGEPDGRA